MSSLSETTLESVLTSAPPMSATASKVIIGVLVLTTMMAFIVHLASPMRLTRVLVAAISNAEQTYLEAIETGVLSQSDVHITGMLSSLEIKVSHIREATLRNSLSRFGALCDFFQGRSFTVVQCIREVRELEAHIEILKEERLRDPNPLEAAIVEDTKVASTS
ncbi:hypothetical protein C8R44DRAFT_738635 [Mycena epipterygia]|nr:hypothetical protein C8R44DRAFT_738635 [Mycena epipterygia]